MADQKWTPDRLRALDVAVAEARGWTNRSTREGGLLWWFSPSGEIAVDPPPVASVGCKETFDLLTWDRGIYLTPLVGGTWVAIGDPYDHDTMEWEGPTPAVAICLAYLAAKGRPFNG